MEGKNGEGERLGHPGKGAHLAAILAITLPIWYFIIAIDFDLVHPPLPYPVTEWLVTYSGGFVRRGILGESVLQIGSLLHASPLWVLFSIRVVLSAAFLAVIAGGVFRNRKSIGLTGVLLVLLNPAVVDYACRSLGAVDLLFILLAVANQSLAMSLDNRRYERALFLLMATVGILIALGHEALLVLGLPLNMVISFRKLESPKWPRLVALYALPVITCLLAAKFSGTRRQAALITQVWAKKGIVIPTNSAVHVLGASVEDGFRFVRHLAQPADVAVCIFAALVALAPVVGVYRIIKVQREASASVLLAYLLIPLLAPIPLYFVGVDWNRWIGIPLCASITCLLYTDMFNDPLRLSKNSLIATWICISVGAFTIPAAPYFGIKNVFHGSIPSSIQIMKQVAKSALGIKSRNPG